MTDLADVAPAFVDMAHRIVWCVAATTGRAGRPSTRVLHPIWEWDGAELTGWILTSPNSPKAADLAVQPALSLTYWDPSHDTCTANCDTSWDDTPEGRQAGWDRFVNGPPPVGYDPRIIPQWTSPDASEFGVLRLHARSLRVMPGTVMTAASGETADVEAMTAMTDADELEAIRQLKARYFRHMDEKDWLALADVFTEDVEMDMRGEGSELIRGRDVYMPFIRQTLDGVTTVHHGHMPELTLTSATTASGVWAMEDKLWWPPGGPIAHLHGYGHYHETYERGADGAWRIKTCRLTRLHREFVTGSP